jgi:prepilin-type N-terminal cleavage/methylation domain-containing protein
LKQTHGVTLLELLVVLTVLGIVLAVSGLAVNSLRLSRGSEEQMVVATVRAQAIHSGASRTANGALFLPDGRVIGGRADPLTGRPFGN